MLQKKLITTSKKVKKNIEDKKYRIAKKIITRIVRFIIPQLIIFHNCLEVTSLKSNPSQDLDSNFRRFDN
ncbi:hypothetical protein BpHYR1_043816 [Brachionus plicatilis]|uniref:Uncharacterized protein n=1 Tax=Brachionus plicatilis TaxID=10195 RepID=A0A3M7RWP6_BRAPC|nr:hypothetical protein BpHYR1_043816 [Brachionus plicatilis]